MVTPGMRLADIGTDHAYVPIYLVEQGRIPSAIAMDINEGPLERAKEHIRRMGLEGKIKVRQSDGLWNLKKEEADSMIAAGMGGGLVIRILSERQDTAKHMRECILQPQSEIKKVREYLCGHGFTIVEEEMVLEDGKYYPMMKAVPGDALQYTDAELQYGKLLLEMSHPVLKSFLERERAGAKKVAEGLAEQSSGRAGLRAGEMAEKIRQIEALLYRYF